MSCAIKAQLVLKHCFFLFVVVVVLNHSRAFGIVH